MEWDKLLKYLLFAYRTAPHSNGFSPFEIIYDRSVRGPLESLRDSWDTGEVGTKSVVQWVDEIGKKLTERRGIVKRKEAKAKERMKEY